MNQSSHTVGCVPLRDIQVGVVCSSKSLETTQMSPLVEGHTAAQMPDKSVLDMHKPHKQEKSKSQNLYMTL